MLVLTTFLDEHLVLQAIRAGARGYVVKDVDTSALIRAIRDVSRGESAFDARSAAAMVRGLNAPPVEQAKQLTAREREVLQPARPGAVQPRHRRAALHLRDHREVPRRQHPAQARRLPPRRGGLRGQQARRHLTWEGGVMTGQVARDTVTVRLAYGEDGLEVELPRGPYDGRGADVRRGGRGPGGAAARRRCGTPWTGRRCASSCGPGRPWRSRCATAPARSPGT